MKTIFVINGSASANSSNQKLIDNFVSLTKGVFNVIQSVDLKMLPHFDPALSATNTPESVLTFRSSIEQADGVLICTPEYIFSIPSGLKNAFEWCVSTVVFTAKPMGIITASANGEKGHEELQLIANTVMAKFTPETTLLIKGIKGKISESGDLTDDRTREALKRLITAFGRLL